MTGAEKAGGMSEMHAHHGQVAWSYLSCLTRCVVAAITDEALIGGCHSQQAVCMP